MTPKPVIFWFRQDLRLADNPGLHAAIKTGASVIPVFILDDPDAVAWKSGAASRWWLHHSLERLQTSLSEYGFDFILRRGSALDELQKLVEETGATTLFWNRCYEQWRMERDQKIETHFRSMGLHVENFKSNLLFEPQEITTQSGTPFRVFTPFYKACLAAPHPRAPIAFPRNVTNRKTPRIESLPLSDLSLLPRIRWDEKLAVHWQPGEDGALKRLSTFVKIASAYKRERDRPDKDFTSFLSPHLHWGEISPFQVWHAIGDLSESFLREIIWREFAHHVLFHNHQMPEEPLQAKFKPFPWNDDPDSLARWQKGQTGIPIVDAGMRQLWATGWMHNRVRMIAGSFLVKNLRLHWRHGRDWFWDCLVDADLANNSAGWQWIAGCGVDAAPYFRIFNPILQGEKFDTDGVYVRRWVPELADMPTAYIHKPWLAPQALQVQTYPSPIVDLAKSRRDALEAFARIRALS